MSPIYNHLLSAILLTPLAGALVILLVSARRPGAIRWVANAFGAAGFLVSVPLWFLYEPHGKTWQFAERGPGIPSIGASYYLGVDGFSILLILLTTLIGWIAMAASWEEVRERVKEFYALMLILQTGILGAFMSLDFLLFFLFWQVALVPMYLLIRIKGSGSRRSAITFLLYTLAGSVAMLFGILGLYFHSHAATGAYTFDITQFHTLQVPFEVQKRVFLAFFAGFAVTVPMFPFHAWLPGAQADAPTAGSVLLAAVLLKMGTYGFLRFSLPILPDASRYFAPMLVTLAIAGIVYGAVVALAQSDWKRLVAYASVSHMGMVVLGIFALTPVAVTGSIVQQFNYGISTGALCLLLGVVYERRRTSEIRDYGGLRRVMPVFATIFVIMTMASIGLPALNGFIGQRLILQGVYAASTWWAAVAAAGTLLGAAYMLKLCWRTLSGPAGQPANAALRDLNAREVAVFAPLVAIVFWIGLYPAPVLRRLETSVGRVVVRINPAYGPYVAQGSDCATPASPDPAGPPPMFVLVEPCADGSDAATKPAAKPADTGGTRRR